jgi:hypothetical protein
MAEVSREKRHWDPEAKPPSAAKGLPVQQPQSAAATYDRSQNGQRLRVTFQGGGDAGTSHQRFLSTLCQAFGYTRLPAGKITIEVEAAVQAPAWEPRKGRYAASVEVEEPAAPAEPPFDPAKLGL